MCGIAGIVGKQPSEKALSKMTNLLSHRGPDGEGHWYGFTNGWNISLGHRRLSIIDLESGVQPLVLKDKRKSNCSIVISFNGEIYNYRELQKELYALGHSFSTQSDTEVIARAYMEWGTKSFEKLDGFFGFALWDENKEELYLARDRSSIKPFYYSRLPGGGLAFSSELAPLQSLPEVNSSISRAGLASYFFYDSILPPYSILEGVQKLDGGNYIRWNSLGQVEIHTFSQLIGNENIAQFSENNVNEFGIRLERAVDLSLVSDVPVGLFLSGGIDSSTIAAIAQKKNKERLKSFSITFDDTNFDEGYYSRLVAKHIQTEHIEKKIDESSLIETINLAIDGLDEPFADPSYLPTFLLSNLAKKHVKVCLGGDGADELLAGYPTYRAHRYANLISRLPRFFTRGLINPWVKSLKMGDGYQPLEWKLKRFFLRWDEDPVRRHFRWMSDVDLPNLQKLMGDKYLEPDMLRKYDFEGRDKQSLSTLLLVDFYTYLAGVLTKVDRASMANGLEVRPPFLENDFVNWAMRLPNEAKLNGTQGKYILKQYAAQLLPHEVIHRPKKGFAIPLTKWMRGPLQSEITAILKESPLWDLNLISHEVVSEFWQEFNSRAYDHSRFFWALLVLHRWKLKKI